MELITEFAENDKATVFLSLSPESELDRIIFTVDHNSHSVRLACMFVDFSLIHEGKLVVNLLVVYEPGGEYSIFDFRMLQVLFFCLKFVSELDVTCPLGSFLNLFRERVYYLGQTNEEAL
jgi:hypothetical protein